MRTALPLCLILLASANLVTADTAPDRPPNILLVLTDDQGWGDLSSHGNNLLDTPTLDRLADSGARFDRFYVCPVCAPTRAGLLTGRYHPRTGAIWVTRGLETMRGDETTIAEILQQNGYATGCFGKWHNGAHHPGHPNSQGFDTFLGFLGGHWNLYFDSTLERNGQPQPTKGYISDVLTDAAIDFMREHREAPFFCYVPYNTPHAPFQIPDHYFDKYKAKGLDDTLAAVYGMVENIDGNVARLLAALDDMKLADNTIVLFLTDNGPNTDRYNGGMRGRKGSVHEGGVRVPLLVRWPRHIKTNTVVPRIAAHIDILPTLLDAAGIDIPASLKLDGRSLLPVIKDAWDPDWPDRKLFVHQFRGEALGPSPAPGSVRTERFRFVREGNRAELFDMQADPAETTDVSAQHPEVARELASAHDAWYADVFADAGARPPIPVGHPAGPIVELPAPEASFNGGIRFQGKSGWAHDWLTGWTDTEDYVSWEIDVLEGGEYEVSLLYTCPPADVGARLMVAIGNQWTSATVSKAHDPPPLATQDRVPRTEVPVKTWAELEVGTLRLEPGRAPVAVRALEKPGKQVIDLKALRLKRK